MRVADLICPACDGRVIGLPGPFELARSTSTNQVQTLHATCERGHPLTVGWTPRSLSIAAEEVR